MWNPFKRNKAEQPAQEPTASASTTEAPAAEAPKAEEAPKTEAPKTEAPKADATADKAAADAAAAAKASAVKEAEEKFAKAPQTGKIFSLYHGAEKLEAIAAKETAKTGKEVLAKDLSFIKKLRPGKTALVAGAVGITTAMVAGMGNKGPGKNAETEVARDDNQQAVARA